MAPNKISPGKNRLKASQARSLFPEYTRVPTTAPKQIVPQIKNPVGSAKAGFPLKASAANSSKISFCCQKHPNCVFSEPIHDIPTSAPAYWMDSRTQFSCGFQLMHIRDHFPRVSRQRCLISQPSIANRGIDNCHQSRLWQRPLSYPDR
jgi:hypothetical protein